MAAHALAVAVAAATAQPRVVIAPAQRPAALDVRLIAGPAVTSSSTPATPAASLPPAESAPVVAQVAPVVPVAAAPLVPLVQSPATPAATTAATNHADDYLPRELLTQPPAASGLIVVPYPPALPPGSRHSLALMLYVDETGVVRRVRTEGSAPMQAMVTAAHQTFLRARFTPGEIDGRAVKSMIEVEVTFDSTPLDAAH